MINLMLGDCLERMKEIPDKSVDMVLCDPPYQSTECAWDTLIPFADMWCHLKRVTKPEGAIVLFAAEVFTAQMILSNEEMYRYSLVWRKNRIGRFAQAKGRFLNEHEDLLVFSSGKCSHNSKIKMKYYPQGLLPLGKMMKDSGNRLREGRKKAPDYFQEFTNYPKSILEFASELKPVHPTQKPVPLLEYLIETYTLPGEMVLDFTMGSGSTGVAAKQTGRSFIGIERDENYFEIAKRRIESTGPDIEETDDESQLEFPA